MFERLNDSARHVIVLASTEAVRLGYNYQGSEHLLLALRGADANLLATRVLAMMGVTVDNIEAQIQPPAGPDWEIRPYTPRIKRIFEYAALEAQERGSYIEPEHLLLAMVKPANWQDEDLPAGAVILDSLGCKPEWVYEVTDAVVRERAKARSF